MPKSQAGSAPAGNDGPRQTRDQLRALNAYKYARAVQALKDEQAARDYKAAAQSFGGNIMRQGLSGALAVLERDQSRKGIACFLDALAGAGVAPLEQLDRKALPDRVRGLDTLDYMLATREFLELATWLKRAAEATLASVEGRG